MRRRRRHDRYRLKPSSSATVAVTARPEQDGRALRAAQVVETERLEQGALQLGAIADDPRLPARLDGVPKEHGLAAPAAVAQRGCRGLAGGDPVEAQRDALGCDGCDRVDADPAFVLEPHLGPRVRVGLPHDVVAADAR